MIDPTNYRALLMARIQAKKAEAEAQFAAKDSDIAKLREKLDQIHELAQGLGTVPTLSKLRDFLAALKTLMQEASRG